MGWMVFLLDSADDPERELRAVKALHQRRVDGAGLRAATVPGMPPDARLSVSMGAASLEAGATVEQAIHRAERPCIEQRRTDGID